MLRVSLLSLLLTSACSFQMQARSSASGAGTPAPSKVQQQPEKRAKHKRYVASFHKSGSVHASIDWQGRSGRVCRAVTPFRFVGTAQLAGSARLRNGQVDATGTAKGSGKATGGQTVAGSCEAPRAPVPKTPPPTPVTHPERPAPKPARTKPKPADIGKAPTKNPDPVKVQDELDKPVEPPAEPPPNVFGYEKPVRGCFEGQVFPLQEGAPQLPTSYASLEPVSVLYACEWDIAPRAWDRGFPGVDERFEWFAIRYAGAFRVADAGEYAFRLSSDDGSKLTIDGQVVIDNDKQHPPKVATGKVQLAAGDHQMVLEYFQGPRFEINLQLWVTPPGKPEELFTVR